MAQGRLNLTVGALEGAPLLKAVGDVDFQTLGELSRAVEGVLDQGSGLTFLDFRNVRSMDAGAMGVLVNACRSVGPERKLCVIARGQSEQVLHKTRLDSMMYVVRNNAEAVKLIKRAPRA